MELHQLCILLTLLYYTLSVLGEPTDCPENSVRKEGGENSYHSLLPVPKLHFENIIIEDDDTEIMCSIQHTECLVVGLEIIGNATLKDCSQRTENHSNNVMYTNKTCTVEVTKEMDQTEFICEAHFTTKSKPEKMYLQSEPTITDCPKKFFWVEGEENSFHCKATGYPHPTVTCEKGHATFLEGVKYKSLRNMTGNYSCIAKNFDVSTKPVEVFVQYKPEVLNIKVNPPLRNVSDSVTMTCEADGEPAPVYSWRTPSSDVQFSPDNTTITIQNMKTSHLGKYRCTTSNKHGDHSLEKDLTFEATPKILGIKLEPSTEVFEGDNVTVSCEAIGFPTPTLRWNRPEAVVEISPDQHKIKIWKIKKAHTGSYSCTAQNKHGTATKSQNITLAVKPKVLSINVKPSTTVSENENLTMICVAQGVPRPTYSWQLPTVNVLLSHDNSTVNILAAQKAHVGDYSCTAQNKHGRDTMTKRITVTDKGNGGDKMETSITVLLTVLISACLTFYLC